jgi:hypothetical protein
MLRYSLAAMALGGAVFAGTAAHASVIGFQITLDGDVNIPTITLVNQSDTALITNFMMTIGNTAYNWDAVVNVVNPAGGGSILNMPDNNLSGGARSNVIDIDFSGFDPTEFSSFDGDVDIDSSDTSEDFRTVLFNNGGAANSHVLVSFSNGTSLGLDLSDGTPGLTSYTFSASQDVPVPAGAAMMIGGLAGLTWLRRRG